MRLAAASEMSRITPRPLRTPPRAARPTRSPLRAAAARSRRRRSWMAMRIVHAVEPARVLARVAARHVHAAARARHHVLAADAAVRGNLGAADLAAGEALHEP